MKNKIYMRLISLIGIMLVALLTITACSASTTESSETVEATDIQTEEAVPADDEDTQNEDTTLEEDTEVNEKELQERTESTTDEEEIVSDDDYDRESALAAYREALTQLYEKLIFPSGIEAEYQGISYDMSTNQFAVYDVDMDNRDELIILYTTSSMAGMSGRIYDYDETTDSLYLELIEFPSLKFYDNAMLEAGWSHSQGYAGAFWIYTLYTYDSENDTYQDILHTDAWDRALGEVDYYGNTFPEEADVDGDGIVYYILQIGEYEYHDPIDWDEYETWHNETVGNEIEVPYMNLTLENVTAIE